jgi:hypothetical protein
VWLSDSLSRCETKVGNIAYLGLSVFVYKWEKYPGIPLALL